MSKPPVWKHFAAFIYDIFPVIALLFLTSWIVLIARNWHEVDRDSVWFKSLLVLEIAFYYIYSWKKGGQTIGMKAWKMKISVHSGNLSDFSWGQAILRFFAGLLSTLFLGLGVFWKLTPYKRSWMDMLSKSETIISEK